MNEILKDEEKRQIIEEIKKHSYILPKWLKDENEKYIDIELNMSEFFKKENNIILIKPPIGWSWQIKRNY